MKIIAFANQKGGVGKTTCAANIGAYLAELGYKTLLIDFDPQGNLSSTFGLDGKKNTIYSVFSGQCSFGQALLQCEQKNLSLVPSDISLAAASIEFIEQPNREFFLKNILLRESLGVDYVIIDCAPSLDLLTINALSCADYVFIPLQCEYFALEGLRLLLDTLKRVRGKFNPSLKLKIMLTMFDQRTRLSREVVDNVLSHFGDSSFKTIIPRSIYLSEAPSNNKTINYYHNQSAGAKAYLELTKEIVECLKKD